ncbi:helix-turn-helix domain-containing protein [Pelagibacterium limicola]|uniref:helix-turn-helix domain-containing protein n=1 Tax=Pelagibacterium limicola TaxID=2791022 RepID=UPI0018AF70F3|nr:helix-turn-helix domain-containing protein [Pelagibacterium limicola]
MNLPPDLRYERFAPTSGLADYIEHFWIIEADVGPTKRLEILTPNGRPVILVSLAEPGERIDPQTGTSELNQSAVTGIATRPVIIGQTGRSRLVAAQPTPFGLSALGAPLAVDGSVPLADWLGNVEADRLVAALAESPLGEEAARRLERALSRHLCPLAPAVLTRLQRAIAQIEAASGDIEVAALVRNLDTDYDRLYRDFRLHLGISPKTFIAIVRYHNHVGRLLADTTGGGLAQLAVMQGYYDQAHANRDFRRFTGVSPTHFRETLNGIAKMMHGI